eukprot:498760-Amphidinium_carterae.1
MYGQEAYATTSLPTLCSRVKVWRRLHNQLLALVRKCRVVFALLSEGRALVYAEGDAIGWEAGRAKRTLTRGLNSVYIFGRILATSALYIRWCGIWSPCGFFGQSFSTEFTFVPSD